MSGSEPSSDISGIARSASPGELRPIEGSELTRYDFLLATIPLVLLAAWIAGQFAAVPLWASLSVGALIVIPALVDGIALNPPT